MRRLIIAILSSVTLSSVILAEGPAEVVHMNSQELKTASSYEIRVNPIFSIPEQEPPKLTSLLIDGKAPENGDMIGSQPVIELTISAQNLISTWSITLKQASTIIDTHTETVTPARPTARTTWQPSAPLSEGLYTLEVTMIDSNDNRSATTILNLAVSSALGTQSLVVGPNPYSYQNDDLTIEYQLSQAANVSIYVMSIDGEQQWQTHIEAGNPNGGDAGFNQVNWDGRNRFGERLANGPYLVYVQTTQDDQHVIKKAKLLVLD